MLNSNLGNISEPLSIGQRSYKTTKVGGRLWMAENLDVEIPGSMIYDNNTKNIQYYGRLYSLDAASSIIPSGWHLPTKEEWIELISFYSAGKNETEGFKLKKDCGFNIQYSGYYSPIVKRFAQINEMVYYWTSSCDVVYFHFSGQAWSNMNLGKNWGCSVRYVMN